MSFRNIRFKLIICFILGMLAIAVWGGDRYLKLPDQRLSGDWRVDTEATLKDWDERTPLSPTRARFWRDTWQHMVVTYYPDRYVTTFRSQAKRQFFSTRRRAADKVVIRVAENGKRRDVTIHFEGPDRMWMQFAEGDERRQYFVRSTTEESGDRKPSAKASSSAGLAAILGQ